MGIRSHVSGHRPHRVHRVLASQSDTEATVETTDDSDHQTRDTAADLLRIAQVVTDHRKLMQRRVQDLLLKLRVARQHEAENGREQQKKRKERDEAVVSDQRG